MSRAFVKESESIAELPDRPISAHRNLVTEEGLAMIEGELAKSQALLKDAHALGDREAIARASRDFRYWTQRHGSAEVQDKPASTDVVAFGSTVTIERPDGRAQTFRIVGEDESDPASGSISYTSPMAQALLGKSEGDEIIAGQSKAEIIEIL